VLVGLFAKGWSIGTLEFCHDLGFVQQDCGFFEKLHTVIVVVIRSELRS
jgi:hypothetical protein